jgi:hypothetical protein
LGKEDSLVKTALTFVLSLVAGIGLSANSRATAQQPAPPYDPAYTTVAPQQNLEPLPPGFVNAGNGAPTAPPPNAPARPGLADDDLLLDNGLWEGATTGPGCAICGGGSSVPPADWYMEQDVRVLIRSRPQNFGITYTFGTETSTTIGTEVMNSCSTAPNISGVWGMTVGHYFARDTQNRDHFIEFSFWGGNNWQDEAAVNGQRVAVTNSQGKKTSEHGNLYSGYATEKVLNSLNQPVTVLNGTIVPGFDRADRQTTFYTSSTNNFEINGRFTPRGREDRMVLYPNGKWRRECQPGRFTTFLYGARFFQLNESFSYNSFGRTDIFDPSTGALIDSITNTGSYDIATHNNILGLQVGMDITFRQCRWEWGLYGKVGPGVNFSDQVSYINAGPEGAPTFVRRLAWSKHATSLVSEAGIHASYKFRPNLIGRASYDFMWITGMALAPEQIQFNPAPVNQIDSDGFLFLNGLKLGLEWLW